MPPVGPLRSQPSSHTAPPGRVWGMLSIVAAVIAVILSLVVFGSKIKQFQIASVLLLVLLLAICTVIFVHGRFLLYLNRQHRQTAGALQASEQDFEQMADNIQEIF